MSEPAGQPVDLITGKFCPKCGYDMTGHESERIVQCPECAAKHVIYDLRSIPPSRWSGNVHEALRDTNAYPWIFVFILIMGSMIGLRAYLKGNQRPLMTQRMVNALYVSSSAFTYAAENNDLMPDHLATLVVQGYAPADVFVDPEISAEQRVSSFHSLEIRTLDDTPESQSLMSDALAQEDPNASYYRFGDTFFPRFPKGWRMSQVTSPEVVLHLWTLPNANGERMVAFFDGRVETIEASRWEEVWQRDSQERIRMGVPMLSRTVVTGEDEQQ